MKPRKVVVSRFPGNGLWAAVLLACIASGFWGMHGFVNAVNEHGFEGGDSPDAGWANLIFIGRAMEFGKFLLLAVFLGVIAIIARPKTMRFSLADCGVFVALLSIGMLFVGTTWRRDQARLAAIAKWQSLGGRVTFSPGGDLSEIVLGGRIVALPNDPKDWGNVYSLSLLDADISHDAVNAIPILPSMRRVWMQRGKRTWRIKALLSKLPKLESLNIEDSQFSDLDADDIVSHAGIVDVGAGESVISVNSIVTLINGKSIKSVNLRGTRLTDEMLLEIATQCKPNRAVAIYAYGNPATREGMKAASARCPNLVFD